MVFGRLSLCDSALHTHTDSYMLVGISVVSNRRPFLTTGLMLGTFLSIFSWGFWDILLPGERIAIGLCIGLLVCLGLVIGQLRLISRDLCGSPISDAVFGTYRHLNAERQKIVAAIEASKSEPGL